MADRLVELVARRKGLDPPPWVIWEALCDPLRTGRFAWFDIRPGEMAPAVLHQTKPSAVTWSSIWEDQPDLRVEFKIDPGGSGSMVTWTLMGRPGQHEPKDLERRRYRLNQLINGQLRDACDN